MRIEKQFVRSFIFHPQFHPPLSLSPPPKKRGGPSSSSLFFTICRLIKRFVLQPSFMSWRHHSIFQKSASIPSGSIMSPGVTHPRHTALIRQQIWLPLTWKLRHLQADWSREVPSFSSYSPWAKKGPKNLFCSFRLPPRPRPSFDSLRDLLKNPTAV